MLTAIQTVAMTKASKASKIEAGEHEVDFTVRVKGTVRKGEDYNSTTYAAVPFDKMLAVALSKLNGVTVESIMREALDDNDDRTKEIKEQAKLAIRKLVDSTEQTMSGKTTASLTVEVVEAA